MDAPSPRQTSPEGLLHPRHFRCGAEGRHGLDGASAVLSGHQAGSSSLALSIRRQLPDDNPIRHWSAYDLRQGHSDFLREPAHAPQEPGRENWQTSALQRP